MTTAHSLAHRSPVPTRACHLISHVDRIKFSDLFHQSPTRSARPKHPIRRSNALILSPFRAGQAAKPRSVTDAHTHRYTDTRTHKYIINMLSNRVRDSLVVRRSSVRHVCRQAKELEPRKRSRALGFGRPARYSIKNGQSARAGLPKARCCHSPPPPSPPVCPPTCVNACL